MTPDGRYATLGPQRLDLDTGDVMPLPFGGHLSEDGSTVVGVSGLGTSESRIVRHDIGTGVDTPLPDLPSGWYVHQVTGISGDAGRVGAFAQNGNLADIGAFTYEASSGGWMRPDATLGVDGMDNSSREQQFSTDGSVVVFHYQRGPTGCTNGCHQIWASSTSGLELINPTPAGTAPETGQTDLIDVSANGRYVLLLSTSSDIEGGPAAAGGSMYVRDRLTGTTSRLDLELWPDARGFGGISDDGQRVVFISHRRVDVAGQPTDLAVAALMDRRTGITTMLAENDSADWTIGGFPHIDITAAGDRVLFTTSWSEHRPIVADITSD